MEKRTGEAREMVRVRLSASPFLFPLAIVALFIFPMAAYAEFEPAERDALVSIRESLNSSLGGLHSLWTGPPCVQNRSRWVGVECADDHVVRLVLERMQLTGSLPPDCLMNLSLLTKVSFKNNSIYGSLPKLHGLRQLRFVFFAENRFSGPIPYHYARIRNLTTLDLQGNCLTGKIPPFNQKSLTGFDVSDNHLQGRIPATAVLRRFGEDSFRNNPGLCGRPLINQPCSPLPPPPSSPPDSNTPSPPKTKKWAIRVLLPVVVAVIALLLALFCCFLLRRRTRHSVRHSQEKEGAPVPDASTRTSMAETEEMKRSLSNCKDSELGFFDGEMAVFDLHDLLVSSAQVMGQGRTGTSYKAILECGLVVAVKRLKVDADGITKKDFIHHLQRLGSQRHENLTEMVAFCYCKYQKLVVYEYVPGGSLYERLHGTLMLKSRGRGRVPLRWKTRLRVIKGIAKGLAFMHETLNLPHTNLKSTNILLIPGKAHPKLSHYGLEPIIPRRSAAESLAAARSPEFADEKKFTYKSDVWCFGVVLLEVITGRAPAEFPSPSWSTKTVLVPLSEWVRCAVSEEWSTDVLDLEILPDIKQHTSMLRIVDIALECTDPVPDNRPEITDVVRMIEEIEQEEGIPEEEVEEDEIEEKESIEGYDATPP